MTSRTTISGREACTTNLETDEAKEKVAMVARNFVNMMDNYAGWSPYELHEDVVMDWFGYSLRGRSSVLYFLKTHVPKTHHVIESVSKIPPITHRLLKKTKRSEALPQASSKSPTEECGQGDCKGLCTPENAVLPNLDEMVKAPRIKRPNCNTTDWEECNFLEIHGKVEFESTQSFEMNGDKKLERIVLAYTDQIHLIVYEAKNNCRKKLFA